MSKRKRGNDFDSDNVKVKSERVEEDCDMDCLFCFNPNPNLPDWKILTKLFFTKAFEDPRT